MDVSDTLVTVGGEWVGRFVLCERGSGQALMPFKQALAAADMLIRVAEDSTVDAHARHRTAVVYELLAHLDAEADRLCRRTSGETGDNLTGIVRAHATLIDVCAALLDAAGPLSAVCEPKARIELAAAVEALRAAIGTAQMTIQVNLVQVADTDVRGELAAGLTAVDALRDRADRVGARLRETTASVVPAARSPRATPIPQPATPRSSPRPAAPMTASESVSAPLSANRSSNTVSVTSALDVETPEDFLKRVSTASSSAGEAVRTLSR